MSDLFAQFRQCARGGEPERLDAIVGRVLAAIVGRAARERPSDQDSTPAREAEGVSVACEPDGDALWVGRLAAAGAAWVRALRVLARDEQDAVLREMEQILSKTPGCLTSVCEIANGPSPDPNPVSRHRTQRRRLSERVIAGASAC
jgi:hypothetical protein